MKKKGLDKKGENVRIKEQLLDYYRNINEQLESGFETEEQKELFFGNVFEQLAKDAADVVRHQRTSFIIEKLIGYANSDQLGTLLQQLSKNFDKVITDRSASYVLQSALYKCSELLKSTEDSPVAGQIHQLGMKFLERAELLMQSHASHVVRSLIEVMSGVQVGQDIVKGKHSHEAQANYMTEHDLFGEFEDLLIALSQMIFANLSSTSDIASNPHSAALAQVFLTIFHKKKPDHCQQLCSGILSSEAFTHTDSNGLPSMLTGTSSSFFCSALVKVLNKKNLSSLLKSVIIPSFEDLISQEASNHVVQDVIEHLQSSVQLSKVIRKLKNSETNLFQLGKAGIILKLIIAALKFTDKQPDVLELLNQQVGCSEDSNLFKALVLVGNNEESANPAEQVLKGLQNLNYLQSMIIQKLLEFHHCPGVVSGIENLKGKYVVALACNKFGSFVYNAYLNSPHVPMKNKKALAENLKDVYPVLVKESFGSRVFEAFWHIMSVPCMKQVLEDLQANESALMGNKFSRIVAYRTHLSDFIHRRKEWDAWIIEENKKRKMALLTDDSAESTKQKLPKKASDTGPETAAGILNRYSFTQSDFYWRNRLRIGDMADVFLLTCQEETKTR